MSFIKRSILFTVLSLLGSDLHAKNPNQTQLPKTTNEGSLQDFVKVFGQRYTFESKILSESRELLIHLPEGYPKAGIQYPVLYVLDGNNHFKHSILAAQRLFIGGKIPQAIIVGIPNNTGKRGRDSFNGRETFVAFIELEVMNYINKHYQSSGHNILFGHSAMGLVTLSIFANHNTLFNQYIASSPAVDHTDTVLFDQLENVLIKHKNLNQSIYFSVGEKTREGKGFTDGAIHLSKIFTNKAPKSLTWRYDFMPAQNHTTAAYPSLFKGLSAVFSDYESPALTSYEAFERNGGMSGLTKFFEYRGNKYKNIVINMQTLSEFLVH